MNNSNKPGDESRLEGFISSEFAAGSRRFADTPHPLMVTGKGSQAMPPAEPSAPAAPIIGWHIRMRGCDGSADWIELGPERPTDVPAEADVLAVVHAGASAMAAQPATEQAGSRTDGMGVPLSCGKPLCSPGGHHSLCHLASQPATAPVVPAGPLTIERLRADFESVKRMGLHRPRFSTKEVGALFAEIDRLAAAPAAPVVQPLTDEQIVRAAVAAMPATSPLVADDLLEGHTMHTEMEDIVAIWKAAGDTKAAPVVPQPAAQQGEAVARVVSWTNGSYWRNYKLEWLRDVPEGAMLYTAPPARQAVALTEEQRAALGIVLDFYADDPRVQCLHPLMAGITPAGGEAAR